MQPLSVAAGHAFAEGLTGPVLVVADDATIAAWAPAWAAAFAATGTVHRVVVHHVDIVSAAAGLQARVVVAAGSAAAVAAARAAARALGVPFVEAAPPRPYTARDPSPAPGPGS